jgi:translocation and assembly module TamA
MFTKVLLSNNIYLNVPGISFLSVAARAALGSIQGSGGEADIPADLRFYAGGAGSIRGYAYQSVSPMVGNDPIGGRSLLTFSLELEVEVISGIGVAGFIDGGSAFTDSFPSNSNELLYGA